MLYFLLSLLNGQGFTMLPDKPAYLMVGLPGPQVISWSATKFQTGKECEEAGQEIALYLNSQNVPAELYCTPVEYVA